ncbi:hypothetical protein SLEP1_g25189 [Rubroshorea leprosula]|uniref:Uncharacterized protein n=1 Tax=Rubroshorea leprosula TaxID=152421 RepID=A0AAV5JP96_9ROSI|nr:hypothetical protein SLEP1_g25189 [Rubroshorea leprosula]
MAVARLIRPLRQWPQVQNRYCFLTALDHLLFSSSPVTVATKVTLHSFSFATVTSSSRNVRHRSRGLILPNSPTLPDLQKEDGETSDSDTDVKKSRNQKKREARRAVRWGMDLASFSTPQIKRILRVAALEQEVLEALMLVKRLGPDVREGKRRQFNYIGKLLREVEPELMDSLIQATKVGDQKTLQHLACLQPQIIENEDDDEESESEDEDQVSQAHTNIASRWFDGLISKDITITNEVYSINSIDFDRQELRKLVRRVHMMKDKRQGVIEENDGAQIDAEIMGAKKSLTHFLRGIARQLPNE